MRKVFSFLKWIGLAGLIGSIIWVIVSSLMLKSSVQNNPSDTSNIFSSTKGIFSAFPFLFGFSALFSIGAFGKLMTNPFAEKKLRENGLLTLATLTNIRQTGMYVNEQPQVEMTFDYKTMNNTQVKGICRMVLPYTEISQLQIGTVLPVRYDINKTEVVVIDQNVSQETLQRLNDELRVRDGTLSQEAMDIATNGEKATGVILENRPTGKVDDKGRPELALRIKVTTADGSTYETQTTRFIIPESVLGLQAGCVVIIYYMKDNPHNIAIGTR